MLHLFSKHINPDTISLFTAKTLSKINFLLFLFTDLINGQSEPRLDILPTQSVQRKPVGKSLMLTCRPNVPDSNLVSDLQWRDNLNLTVLPKP